MIEGNNDIFSAGGDTLGYLAGPMHKKYSMTFIWGHPFSAVALMTNFFDPSYTPTCSHMYAFRVPSPFAYVMLSI